MKRRELLFSSGGAAAVLLSGRVPRAQARQTQDTADIERAIELLPAPDELDAEYRRVTEASVEDANEEAVPYEARKVTQLDGVDLADVDSVATAWTDDQLSVGVIYGSFDAPEPGTEVEEIGDWRIGDDTDSRRATASTDGMLVFANTSDEDERVDAAKVGQSVGVGEADAAVDEMDVLAKALDRLGDKNHFYYIDNLEFGSPVISEQLELFSAGFEVPPARSRGMDDTVENEFFLEAADDVDLDDETVEEILTELEQGRIVDFETEYDGDFVFAETVVETPPERAREKAPDASVSLTSEEATVTFEHQRGESIPADMLELWVNGELADTQPADEFDTFGQGDSLTVDIGPLASVHLRWFDEEENQYYGYVSDVVGRERFETAYDPSAETVEITYTGETEADTDILELSHRRQVENDKDDVVEFETEQLTEPLEDLGETLENGDSLVVEDVEIRDRVMLDLDVPQQPPGTFGPGTTLVRYRVRQPRLSIRNRPDDGLSLWYYDDTTRDAGNFRVLADGEEMETQPSDEYDTLEEGDRIQLPDVEYGTKVVVEWTGGDEAIVVEEEVITPRLYMQTSYDDEAGTVTVSHEGGDTVEADNLELTMGGETTDTQFSDEFETVSQGDSLSVETGPFQPLRVTWSDGDITERVEYAVTGRGLFRGSYDPTEETAELTYTGTQTADASNLELRQYSRGPENEGDQQQPFDDIDTLEEGDSVTIEDVGPEARIRVVVTSDDRRWSTIYRFTAQPRRAFDFDNREGTLVATYDENSARDANEFRLLADGEEIDTQPGDEYDTLEEGDELELGSLEAGTTITVEWPTSGDATPVQEHTVVPDASFAVSYDGDDGELRIEHDGGDGIDADKLGIHAPPATQGLTAWDGDGTVSEGDSMTIESEEKPGIALVIYDRSDVLDRANLSE